MIDPEYISAEQVLAEAPDVLIDTRLEEDYQSSHLNGAASNCVLEMAFAERLPEQAPDKDAFIVVYGSKDPSYEAPIASEKMKRLGYTNVRVLAGGISGWTANGHPTENGNEESLCLEVKDGKYAIDLKESRVEWTGRNLLNKHWGNIQLKSGSITLKGGIPVVGEFIIDMNTILCSDLSGDKTHDVLIDHLKSDDFFDVELYPECRVSILSAEKISRSGPGMPNLSLDLNIRLKDVRSMINTQAVAGVTPEGKLAAQAAFAFDRTMWDVIYGSAMSFMDPQNSSVIQECIS